MARSKPPERKESSTVLSVAKDTPARVLVVDPDRSSRSTLMRILRCRGFAVDAVENGEQALCSHFSCMSRAPSDSDVVVIDPRLPGMDGFQLLREIQSRSPEVPVVILASNGNIRGAVESIRHGAFEYLIKPCEPDDLIAVLRRAVETIAAPSQRARLSLARLEGPTNGQAPRVVGRSEALISVLDLVKRVARKPSRVLLEGESGTGKELMARTLHATSTRSDKPFVAVNCATITPTLADTLFFGHRKGAFTGAERDHSGFFQAAEGGTLFLDEVADLPVEVQGVLMRALEREGSVTPLGSTRAQSVNTRVVSATNRDLRTEMQKGRFRDDLFYRLNVVRIHIPPLRERPDDIPLLVEFFLEDYRRQFDSGPSGIGEDALQRLVEYRWPGNVRELRNVIERIVAVVDSATIETHHLPAGLQRPTGDDGRALKPLEVAERQQIESALAAAGGRKAAAARILGIDRKRLYRKIKRLGLADTAAASRDAHPACPETTQARRSNTLE